MLRHKIIEQDQPVFGGWLTSPAPALLQAMSRSALDYVGIDCQHGLSSEADAVTLLASGQASSTARMVRVSANRLELIGRVLDAGADGIIVPGVSSALEARQVVTAVRFPPEGDRSYGPFGSAVPRDPRELGSRVLVLPMIETVGGLAAVEEILAVPGVDGVYVGPADLGIALGVGHEQFPATASLEPALLRITRAARSAGRIAGIHAGSELFAARYLDLGFRLLTLGVDVSFVAAGVRSSLEVAGAVSSQAVPVGAKPY